MSNNRIESTQALQESIDYILNNMAGWTQFTSWYMETFGTNRKNANVVWNKAWAAISEDFEDNVKQSVTETLMRLEALEVEAFAENDRRLIYDIIKYRNKIKGGEIERHQVDVKGNLIIDLQWGDQRDPGDEQPE